MTLPCLTRRTQTNTAGAQEGIHARGTEVIVDEYIYTSEVRPITNGTGVRTRNGVEIQADLVVVRLVVTYGDSVHLLAHALF